MVDGTSRTDRGRRVWSLVGIALAAIALIVAGLQSAASLLIDADYLERRLQPRADGAVENASSTGKYAVSIGDVDVNLLTRRLTLEQVVVESGAMRLTIPRVAVRGVQLRRLLAGSSYAANSIRADTPQLIVDRSAATEREDADDSTSMGRDGEAGRSLHERIASALPTLVVERIVVNDGTVNLLAPGDRRRTWRGIGIDLSDVRVDSAAALDPERFLFSAETRVHIEPSLHYSADSLRLLEIGAIDASTANNTVTLGSLRYTPTIGDAEYQQHFGTWTNRVRLKIGYAVAANVDFRRLLDEGSVLVDRIDVDSAFVDVYTDKRLKKPPPTRVTFLHERLQRLDFPLRIDSAFVMHADIFYSEIRPGSPDRGAVSFERASLSVNNVMNREGAVASGADIGAGGPAPAVVQLSCDLFGSVDMDAEIRYWLSEPSLTIDYTGTVGSTPVAVANDVMFNLIGIRMKSGEVENIWFDLAARGNIASGSVRALYRDLEIEVRDKTTGEATLRDRIATFVMDDIRLNRDNVARGDEAARVAAVRHERGERDKVIKFLWHSIRAGLLESAGLR